MELEFDKEIDVLLRRSRDDRGVLVGDSPPEPKKHIDADAIAAFVEDALPTATRLLYIEHFADCDRCRKLLSSSILMSETAAIAVAPAAEVIAAGDAIPWHQRLFRTPNLAMAMGALVLAFGGMLGYIVLQNQDAETNTTVSQVANKDTSQGVPSVRSEAAAENANVASANSVADTADSMPNASASEPAVAAPGSKSNIGPSAGTDERQAETAASSALRTEKEADRVTLDGVPESKPVAATPAPADDKVALGRIASGVVAGERKDEDVALAKKKVSDESDNRRDMPASPAKAGPTRSVGPVQNQSNQVNSQLFEMPVTRTVGGKVFENRSGAWYDRAYRNQQTLNYRRGTDEYKKLDQGLRKIADNLGGTVVIMWKDKAYRIQ